MNNNTYYEKNNYDERNKKVKKICTQLLLFIK